MLKRSKRSVRLPLFVRPERYTLVLTPDLKRFTFTGEEEIVVRLGKPVSEITLHAKELTIARAAAVIAADRAAAAKEVPACTVFDAKSETVRLKFPSKLSKGKITLRLSFAGTLNDKMRGFYRSRRLQGGDAARGGKGKKKEWIATTQFEATDARRAFPCFDEPAMKAVFRVTLVAPKGMMAISNTLPQRITHASQCAAYYFAPTPKMSTYLLAFIVGKFEYLETKTKEGVIVRVFTTSGKKKQGRFALDVAAKTLSFYNDYFAIPYPLPALQLIAIPDFSAGAMENWGAVAYRESALLIDEKNSSAMNRQWVALIVAHELAHQWFGNLVTMEWWTHLWLNEGFASYIEYLAVDHLFPEWDIWTQFVGHDLAAAFRLDGLKNTHPIEVEVRDPAEISEIFDAVSYSKGASVIRMLAAHLGRDVFRNGLRHYLNTHAYGNARTEDLWHALGNASRKPVASMMKQWTGKPGYPVVSVEETRMRTGGLRLRARRFFLNARMMKAMRDATVWSIPLGIEGAPRAAPGLMARRARMLPALPAGTKFNKGETGLFRVRYPSSWMPVFARRVAEHDLPAADRLGILRDAFALAEAGVLPTDDAFTLLAAYRRELDYTAWTSVSAGIGQLANLLFETSHYDAYRNFARSMFADIARKMGWEKRSGERHTDTMLRGLALSNFGAYGDRETVRIAKGHVAAYQKSGAAIDPDIRGLTYGLAAEYGSAAEHALFVTWYRKAALQQEKDRLAGALAAFRDEALLKKTLAFALSREVRSQDMPGVIAGVGANSYGRVAMWQFLQKNWDFLLKRYGDGGGHLLPALIRPLGGFTGLARAREIRRFFKTRRAPGAERTIEQAIERIESHADWLARDYKKIAKFLEHFAPMR